MLNISLYFTGRISICTVAKVSSNSGAILNTFFAFIISQAVVILLLQWFKLLSALKTWIKVKWLLLCCSRKYTWTLLPFESLGNSKGGGRSKGKKFPKFLTLGLNFETQIFIHLLINNVERFPTGWRIGKKNRTITKCWLFKNGGFVFILFFFLVPNRLEFPREGAGACSQIIGNSWEGVNSETSLEWKILGDGRGMQMYGYFLEPHVVCISCYLPSMCL